MEYFDASRKRILYATGESMLTVEDTCKRILKGESLEGIYTEPSDDAYLFNLVFGTDLAIPEEAGYLLPPTHEHTEEDVSRLETLVCNSPRMIDSDEYNDRAEKEFSYFVSTHNVKFLLRVYDLIQKLNENNTVWGVGRGSSCASLIFFLLFINDVDPVKWDINFSELTKESDY